jgi:amino acid transporter
VPASAHPESSFIVSTFIERIYGARAATVFTLLILWTAFGSVFALLLGYSRIPFAAAESGYFFRAFGRLHPTKDFPYVSLLVLGAISIVAGFFSLGTVIDALIVTRILVQFMGQVVGLMLLRRHAPHNAAPVPHVALSAPRAGGAAGVDLRVRHHAAPGDPVRRGRAGPGLRGVPSLVLEHQALAVRPRRVDSDALTDYA